MVAHGEEMAAQVSDLRDSGVLTSPIADRLAETANEMITTGERLARDGTEMRDYAERMLQSLGGIARDMRAGAASQHAPAGMRRGSTS